MQSLHTCSARCSIEIWFCCKNWSSTQPSRLWKTLKLPMLLAVFWLEKLLKLLFKLMQEERSLDDDVCGWSSAGWTGVAVGPEEWATECLALLTTSMMDERPKAKKNVEGLSSNSIQNHVNQKNTVQKIAMKLSKVVMVTLMILQFWKPLILNDK